MLRGFGFHVLGHVLLFIVLHVWMNSVDGSAALGPSGQKPLLALPWVERFTDLFASCGELGVTAADLVFDTLMTMPWCFAAHAWAFNPARLEEYYERYHSFDDQVITKFLQGLHYSTQTIQGGDFDLPDALFYSVEDVWRISGSSMPEDGNPIGNVELPPWAMCDADLFLRLHRAARAKRDSEALAANNVFFNLTYNSLVNLNAIEHSLLRTATEQ
uniref:Secreted protein n=1 Tax=Achlya hypogyna TaxID=1202772 RepID=A0A0A7CP07_ACHHY|nr:secreted protein [Achlya hypogyna]